MAHVTRDPDSLKLGGDQREMTVMFSDLRGFTSFSEKLDPETLVQLLNEYLTVMSDVIFKYDGTIDKYMGDAIMAFWGAPEHQPDHATLACRAALDGGGTGAVERALGRRGSSAVGDGHRHQHRRHEGRQHGSNSRRFDYTVLGDAVNLASRLEGLNKEYGTTLIVSKATLDETGDVFQGCLDLVAVKGKRSRPRCSRSWTPSGCRGSTPAGPCAPTTRGSSCTASVTGWERPRSSRRRSASIPTTARLGLPQALRRADGRSGPPADWDGVYVMTRKQPGPPPIGY